MNKKELIFMNYHYILNPDCAIQCDGEILFSSQDVVDAMNYANNALNELNQTAGKYEIDMFQTLGMRNISSAVSEYFVKSLEKFSNDALVCNPHQDGFPDLLFVNNLKKRQYFNSLFIETNGKKYPINKDVFSNFEYGGIEIKATCGTTPPANIDKNVVKPLVGDQRIDMITQFDWKSHHRQTKQMIGLIWDFIDNVPVFVGAFYSDDLTENDWGKISTPRENGGRTTSVSIMNAQGIKKMCTNWIAVIDDKKYINLFSKPKWIGYKVDDERLF